MGPPTLRIRLLGQFDLNYGGAPLPPLESARTASLLGYLLLRREAPQSRQHLAFLLWPDSAEHQAQTNLRHVLHNLRRALPDADRFLNLTSRTLQWREDAPFWLDVAAFEQAISLADRAADGGLAALRVAVDLYRGDLLQACYDEWILESRERLRQSYLNALERLSNLFVAHGDNAQAILYAERLMRSDPLYEEPYRLLIRLHDERGDRARALRVYHVCAATLERELGIEPSAPTRQVYETLLSRETVSARADNQRKRLGGPPFVGRAPEWSRLVNLWHDVVGGRSQFVLMTGEPGIGKTRLSEEFRMWCAHLGATTADARSYPAEGTLAYGPIVTWLRSEPLKAGLQRLDRALQTELARLLPELLTTVPGLARPEPLPEGDQRQRLFDAVAQAILGSTAPLLLIVDDMQWCDRETLQFLHYLLRVEPEARLLVAATARREDIDRQHPLQDLLSGLHTLGRCTEIPLGLLTRAETAKLAERIMGRPVEDPDMDHLYGETAGNPLFVVEALRAGWSGAQTGGDWLSPRVQAAIEARLAQLSEPARSLVGLAATVGREFTVALLIVASEADENTVVGSLDELWRRRIVREQGADAYDFSHDKIREVAYLALSPPRRRQYHRHVAGALEQLYADDLGPVSGQLAAHYEHAGAVDAAIAWYERAAEASQQLHANIETIRLLDRAIDLLGMLPATPERHVRELEVLTALALPLGWIDGWASERLDAVHQRAIHLAAILGIEPAPSLLRSLALASLSHRDYAAARGFGERLHHRGERQADDVLLVEADYVRGVAAFWQGEFAAARGHFEAAVHRYLPELRSAHLLRYGSDPKVICLSRLGNTLWFLGYPVAAVHARDAALALANEIGHPFSRCVALVFAAVLSLDMRDVDGVRAYAALLTAEHLDHQARPIQVSAEYLGGYLDVLNGRVQVGMTRIQRSLDDSRQGDHAPGARAHSVRVLLEACAVAGDAQTGLATADWALGLSDAARIWEAETRRLRAEFLAVLGAPPSEVETEFERALAVARHQEAKILELRAAISLLRFRLKHGESGTGQVRTQLAAIVAALPDGRDCWDMREAITLLDRT